MDKEWLDQMIAEAQVALKQQFVGLVDTEELKDTVANLFSGYELRITTVQGTGGIFKTSFLTNVKNKDEVNHLLGVFEENTYITTKLSRGL